MYEINIKLKKISGYEFGCSHDLKSLHPITHS